LEALEKLYKNSGAKANIAALFTSRFKIPFKISFPHHFSRNLTVKYKKNNIPVKNNFFVLLKNERIEFLEENTNASNTAFLVMKKINPSLRYNDLTLGAAALKARVIQKIKDGQPVLFSLEKEEYVKANAIFTNGAARVYFFHAPCSSCQLKTILSNIKTRQIIDAGEIVLVFSVMADSFELSRVLQEQKISLPVYLDKNDEFDLFSVITDEKNNPVIIEPGEMNL
jgi:hypothetical protein